MKVKRKEQDIYTPLSWCDRMNSAYQMSIRNSVSAEAILDILTAPSTDSQQELQKRKNGIFSFLKPNAKVNTFLKGLPNSELFDALESMAVIKKWSWNKQVFRLDNDFVHELLNTEEVFYPCRISCFIWTLKTVRNTVRCFPVRASLSMFTISLRTEKKRL